MLILFRYMVVNSDFVDVLLTHAYGVNTIGS